MDVPRFLQIFLDNLFDDVLIQSIMKRFLATVLLSGVLIMNMGMFCHSLCIGGHNEKAHGHQHPANAHVHPVAHHKMTQEMPQETPHGEGCPMGQDMRHGKSHGVRHTLPETFIKCGCAPEDEASSAYEATLLRPIIVDLTPHLKTVTTVTYQHTLFSSRGPIPVERPPKLLS